MRCGAGGSFAAGLTDQESQKCEINLWDRDRISPIKHCYDCHTVASRAPQFITSRTMAEGRAALQPVRSHYCRATGRFLIFHTAGSRSCKCVTSSIRLLRETGSGAPASWSLTAMNQCTISHPGTTKSAVVSILLIKTVRIR